MPAILGKSPTIVFMAPGLSLHEADCTAAAIVTNGPGMYPITEYRSGDAERERLPAASAAATRSMTLAAMRGIFPECVDRDSVFLPNQPDPARPGCRKKWIARPSGNRPMAPAGRRHDVLVEESPAVSS